MPWSHALPDYSRGKSPYGLNLVELAEGLAANGTEELRMVDIGANIGDSALQVLNHVTGRALCVEGDDYWAEYLRMNAGEDPRVTIEEVMLSPTTMEESAGFSARRSYGTTTFVQDDQTDKITTWVSVDDLRGRNPDFADARLIKTDTDGFDPVLVPAMARAWADSSPVLFFEFDPTLAREVAKCEPERLWDELADLGYSRLAVWDNSGDPLGQLDVAEASGAATALDHPSRESGYTFWDVAACRADDTEAAAVFDDLVSGRELAAAATATAESR